MTHEEEDTLFGAGPESHYNACIIHGPERWSSYVTGYHRAIEVLIRHMCEYSPDLDTMIYPLVYLVRHAIELRMKALLLSCQYVLGRKRQVPITHDISRLWRQLKPALKEIYPDYDHVVLADSVDGLIDELTRADPKSVAFRYPEDADRRGSIDTNIRHINLRTVFESYMKTVDALDAVHTAVGCAEDLKRGR